jgi:hypothetical protein
MRLQILSTEHWSLLASRSLAWNESFTRASMFLSTLTGGIVALALVAQAVQFGDGFTLFALVILPILLLIGVATYLRLGTANYHDAMCVVGMNRIRAAYLELAPDVGRYFVMSAHDDQQGIGITMGVQPGGAIFWAGQMLAGTPTVVMILNAVLAGAILSIAALRSGVGVPEILAFGAFGFLIAMLLQLRWARGTIAKARAGYEPLFPHTTTDPAVDPATRRARKPNRA